MRAPARIFTAANAVLLSLIALASCSDKTDGDPQSSTPNAGPSTSVPGVPRVANPIDPGPFLANPCRLVPDGEISQLGEFDPPEPDVDSDEAKNLLGPGCGWLSKEVGGASLSVRIGIPHREHADDGFKGLAAVYKAKEAGEIDHLQPVQLAGHLEYPAVIHGRSADISAGKCGIDVGIADDLTYSVNAIDNLNPGNACPMAQKVAEVVLESMLKGA